MIRVLINRLKSYKTYKFDCPMCNSKLEADMNSFDVIIRKGRKSISYMWTFTCPVCGIKTFVPDDVIADFMSK